MNIRRYTLVILGYFPVRIHVVTKLLLIQVLKKKNEEVKLLTRFEIIKELFTDKKFTLVSTLYLFISNGGNKSMLGSNDC